MIYFLVIINQIFDMNLSKSKPLEYYFIIKLNFVINGKFVDLLKKRTTLKSFLNCSQLFFISWVFSGNIPSFIHSVFHFLINCCCWFFIHIYFSFFSYGVSSDEYLKWWKICLANIVETTIFHFLSKNMYTLILYRGLIAKLRDFFKIL